MTEGDYWVSVVGTIHVERDDQSYWCGMPRPPNQKHTRIGKPTVYFDPAKDTDRRSCERCQRNRAIEAIPQRGKEEMKCNHIPCDKEGIYPVTYNVGFGMMGQGWFCAEHLEEGRKLL